MSNPCTDHLGNHYPSASAMCKYWGIPRTTYTKRIESGWSVEEALTDSGPRAHFKPCCDHKGRKFSNEKAMCRYWYVSESTYRARRKRGWSIEEALTGTGPYRWGTPCTDHLGNHYANTSAMCEAWGISRSLFDTRTKKGYTLEKALTGKYACTDHLGQTFPNKRAMCRHWGINHKTFSERIARGWSVEEALTLSNQQPGPAKNQHNTTQPAAAAA